MQMVKVNRRLDESTKCLHLEGLGVSSTSGSLELSTLG